MEKQARRASFRHSFFSHLVGLFDWLAAATRLRNDAANFAPRGTQPLGVKDALLAQSQGQLPARGPPRLFVWGTQAERANSRPF